MSPLPRSEFFKEIEAPSPEAIRAHLNTGNVHQAIDLAKRAEFEVDFSADKDMVKTVRERFASWLSYNDYTIGIARELSETLARGIDLSDLIEETVEKCRKSLREDHADEIRAVFPARPPKLKAVSA